MRGRKSSLEKQVCSSRSRPELTRCKNQSAFPSSCTAVAPERLPGRRLVKEDSATWDKLTSPIGGDPRLMRAAPAIIAGDARPPPPARRCDGASKCAQEPVVDVLRNTGLTDRRRNMGLRVPMSKSSLGASRGGSSTLEAGVLGVLGTLGTSGGCHLRNPPQPRGPAV